MIVELQTSRRLVWSSNKWPGQEAACRRWLTGLTLGPSTYLYPNTAQLCTALHIFLIVYLSIYVSKHIPFNTHMQCPESNSKRNVQCCNPRSLACAQLSTHPQSALWPADGWRSLMTVVTIVTIVTIGHQTMSAQYVPCREEPSSDHPYFILLPPRQHSSYWNWLWTYWQKILYRIFIVSFHLMNVTFCHFFVTNF